MRHDNIFRVPKEYASLFGVIPPLGQGDRNFNLGVVYLNRAEILIL